MYTHIYIWRLPFTPGLILLITPSLIRTRENCFEDICLHLHANLIQLTSNRPQLESYGMFANAPKLYALVHLLVVHER